jgi:hypothetical protein
MRIEDGADSFIPGAELRIYFELRTTKLQRKGRGEIIEEP